MVIGPGADLFQVRMLKNAQDERMNHENLHLDKFHEKFSGIVLSRLQKAKDKGAISEKQFSNVENMMVRKEYFFHALDFLNTIELLCATAAANLREIDT